MVMSHAAIDPFHVDVGMVFFFWFLWAAGEIGTMQVEHPESSIAMPEKVIP